MEFALSTVQTALQDSVRRFCRSNYDLQKRRDLLESADGFSRDHWTTFAELGWLGVALPSDAGGAGQTAIESAIILEEFGRALMAEPYLSCALMSGHILDSCANPAQRAQLLTPLIQGKLMVAFAHFETDRANLECVDSQAIVLDSGAFSITGKKRLVIGGASADKIIVTARTSGKYPCAEGVGLFVIDRCAEGLLLRDYTLLDGSRACDLDMNGVRVEQENILVLQGTGLATVNFAVDRGIVGLCAEAVGIIDSVLWLTRDHLRRRRQYGVALGSFQALQHRMADMFIEVEMSRSILLYALSVLDESSPEARRASVLAAYLHVCKSGKFVCQNGVQLHGAMGMTEDHLIGQYFKRLTVISGMFGTLDQQSGRLTDLLNIPTSRPC
jgi:alkylation response protein AidB-like acyl-CoA dehydrogenase